MQLDLKQNLHAGHVVSFPRIGLTSSSTHCVNTYGLVAFMTGNVIARCFTDVKPVTHLGTNRAERTSTLTVETNAWTPSRAVRPRHNGISALPPYFVTIVHATVVFRNNAKPTKDTDIYWQSCGLEAEYLDKTRKSLKQVNNTHRDNKPMAQREGLSLLVVTGRYLVMI